VIESVRKNDFVVDFEIVIESVRKNVFVVDFEIVSESVRKNVFVVDFEIVSENSEKSTFFFYSNATKEQNYCFWKESIFPIPKEVFERGFE
jgi:H2-forming N5,N10-methylenetetrahydromethanopterin dehydrogenase-like enzyme